MTLYETTFIIRQDVSEANAKKTQEHFVDVINENNGKTHKQEYWGVKELAYVIKKNRKGHYIYLIIEADSKCMQEFERRMSLNEDVIRSLTIKIDSLPEGSSAMMRNSEDQMEDA